jgi:phytoene synthase
VTAAADPSLVAAFQACREITRKRARNFYYGLKLSPEPQRSALYTMYAWMRRADDVADEAITSPIEVDARVHRIEQLRIATDAACNGALFDGDPLWIAVRECIARFRIRREDLHDLLDGQLADLRVTQYESFESLRTYCRRVASSVGLVCLSIWGCDDEGARRLAIDRGLAFQLTNILRDYREDFDQGRVYLPQQDFRAFGLTPRRLRDWSDPDLCAQFVQSQAERAARCYESSRALDEMISPPFRPTLWAMTGIYQGLLVKIRRDPAAVASRRRVRLSAWRKGAIALRARRMAWVMD